MRIGLSRITAAGPFLAVAAIAFPARAVDGRLYLTGDGLVGITDGEMARQAPAASPGVGFQFGVGLTGIPLTFGLGAHWLSFANQTFRGESGVFYRGGELSFGPTVVQRSIELRQFDMVLRLEPEWRRIRPFVDATAGTGQYFVSWTRRTVIGDDTLDEAESSGDLTLTWGFGAGLNLEPFRRSESEKGSLAFVVSCGVRWFRGQPITNLGPSPDGSGKIAANGRSEVRLIVPFLGVGFQSASPRRP